MKLADEVPENLKDTEHNRRRILAALRDVCEIADTYDIPDTVAVPQHVLGAMARAWTEGRRYALTNSLN